jgi:hypothetical protein
MTFLLSILASAHVWAQTLVASAIKTTWLLAFLVSAVFSGCLTGCTFEVSPAQQPDAGISLSPRALARGPYDVEGAVAWQQFSDLMLRSLAATPDARSWAIVVLTDYVHRDDLDRALSEYQLVPRYVHAGSRSCPIDGTYDAQDATTIEDIEARISDSALGDSYRALPACRDLLAGPRGLTYYAVVLEGAVSGLDAIRNEPFVHRVTPVVTGAGVTGIERPEWR